MLSFASLAVLPLLLSAPEWPSFSMQTAELGGTVVDRLTGRPVSSTLPVVLNLYDGERRVASTQVGAQGRYSLVSPPGDYWLQILVGDEEQGFERVLLREGSWQRELELGVGGPAVNALAALAHSPERDRGRSGRSSAEAEGA